MKNLLLSAGVVSVFIVGGFVSASAEILFYDDFNTEIVDKDKWNMTFWNGQSLGRTTFRTVPFPEITNGNVVITVESYNSEDGSCRRLFLWYGSEELETHTIKKWVYPHKNTCKNEYFDAGYCWRNFSVRFQTRQQDTA